MNNIFHAQNRELSKDYGDLTDLTDTLKNDFYPVMVEGYDNCVTILGYQGIDLSIRYSLNSGNTFTTINNIGNYVFPNENIGVAAVDNKCFGVVRANDNYYACFKVYKNRKLPNNVLEKINDNLFIIIINLKNPEINRNYYLQKNSYSPTRTSINYYYDPNAKTFQGFDSPWDYGGPEINHIFGISTNDGGLISIGGGLPYKTNSQDPTCAIQYHENNTSELFKVTYADPNHAKNDNITIPVVASNIKWIVFMKPYYQDYEDKRFYYNGGNVDNFDPTGIRIKLDSPVKFDRLFQLNNWPRSSGVSTLERINYTNSFYLNGNNEKCFRFIGISTSYGDTNEFPTKILAFDVRIPNSYTDYVNNYNCLQSAQYITPTFTNGSLLLIDDYPFIIKSQYNDNVLYCLYRTTYNDINNNMAYYYFLTKSYDNGVTNNIIRAFPTKSIQSSNEKILDFYVTKSGRIITIESKDKSYEFSYNRYIVYVTDNDYGN